ncbi:hypothetical protein DPMN_052768 [Dreissena polymorpha]|uniref:Uncharacterized protein n=1 Tax=Dreissena polymorpha TaxID=45954 RepID=A0A9D4CLV5_DREPO|nr:hypothetical protein DPMN_052768 [Dreissena polymorpha]
MLTSTMQGETLSGFCGVTRVTDRIQLLTRIEVRVPLCTHFCKANAGFVPRMFTSCQSISNSNRSRNCQM